MARIMIIDDDADFANAASVAIAADGHEVLIELDVKVALDRMELDVPELIVLDVMFPEDSGAGFELARKMHRSEKLRNIPILMLTAVNVRFPLGFSSSDIDEEWLPVTEFLDKPVELDVLRAKVTALLNPS